MTSINILLEITIIVKFFNPNQTVSNWFESDITRHFYFTIITEKNILPSQIQHVTNVIRKHLLSQMSSYPPHSND